MSPVAGDQKKCSDDARGAPQSVNGVPVSEYVQEDTKGMIHVVFRFEQSVQRLFVTPVMSICMLVVPCVPSLHSEQGDEDNTAYINPTGINAMAPKDAGLYMEIAAVAAMSR